MSDNFSLITERPVYEPSKPYKIHYSFGFTKTLPGAQQIGTIVLSPLNGLVYLRRVFLSAQVVPAAAGPRSIPILRFFVLGGVNFGGAPQGSTSGPGAQIVLNPGSIELIGGPGFLNDFFLNALLSGAPLSMELFDLNTPAGDTVTGSVLLEFF